MPILLRHGAKPSRERIALVRRIGPHGLRIYDSKSDLFQQWNMCGNEIDLKPPGVDADRLVAFLSAAGDGNGPDIAETHDADLHGITRPVTSANPRFQAEGAPSLGKGGQPLLRG